MSSDRPENVPPVVDPSNEVNDSEPRSTAEITLEFVKKTWWLLLIALVAFLAVLAMMLFGAPWRSIGIATMITATVGPFLFAYLALWVWYVDRESRRFALLVDDEHQSIGLLDVARDYFAQFEVDGGRLPTRDSQAGKVYLAEKFEVRQDRQIDPATGEEETVPKPTLVATWEGELDPLEFIEERDTLQEQRDKLVPLAREAVKARAGADMKTLDNSIKQMHAIIAGAENDEFIDLGSNPFDYDVDVDQDPLEDLLSGEAHEHDEGESGELPRRDREVQVENGAWGLVSDD